MILLVVVPLALVGGSTWLVLTQSVAGDPGRHQRLTRAALLACVAVAAAVLAVTVMRL
ncbi:hypothetical protein AMIS_31230 [Actinoplanes missouriensis 431]|uniref:Uncharacterized protein n=1 Tax=Actinoplanes missouriensis (strain ATCC 14538 / DSM 43046 / CBS 188.64 / JCM 3121 / NBRC 102363 / NCIMB 12654 / NRRL B-3342 / UNCC 431) TaxID=512565 RepID=I0H5Q6_ACTM4|nr:hypothetical protein [Actinoplanes missouriensis]BAL88343.1 hypothetical protein AMIS_31230 [Actinoplanes missouriensis 431]